MSFKLITNLPRVASYVALSLLLFIAYESSKLDNTEFVKTNDIKKFAPVVYVTLAWFCMWYWLLFQQSTTHFIEFFKLIEKSKKDGDKKKIVLSDVKKGVYPSYPVSVWNTTVRNTMEQSISFLILLWLCAIMGYDGINRASKFGWVWLGCRFIYPYAISRTTFARIFISTIPAYLVQLFFVINVLINISPTVNWYMK